MRAAATWRVVIAGQRDGGLLRGSLARIRWTRSICWTTPRTGALPSRSRIPRVALAMPDTQYKPEIVLAGATATGPQLPGRAWPPACTPG